MTFQNAIVRIPAENFADGLTTSGLGAPDYAMALAQHEAYCTALRQCGLDLTVLPPDPAFPDSTFVEDTAVLTPCCTVLTRPGAASRQGEVEAIRPTLTHFCPNLFEVTHPGTLDGGDICEAGSHFFIGISARTNEEGGRQLAALLKRAGYTASFVDIRGIPGLLHLKSGISYLGDGNLVVAQSLSGLLDQFNGFRVVRVDERESYAANCVRVNAYVLLPFGFPGIQRTLEVLNYPILPLDMSEFQKMDGGLSCLSLRF